MSDIQPIAKAAFRKAVRKRGKSKVLDLVRSELAEGENEADVAESIWHTMKPQVQGYLETSIPKFIERISEPHMLGETLSQDPDTVDVEVRGDAIRFRGEFLGPEFRDPDKDIEVLHPDLNFAADIERAIEKSGAKVAVEDRMEDTEWGDISIVEYTIRALWPVDTAAITRDLIREAKSPRETNPRATSESDLVKALKF